MIKIRTKATWGMDANSNERSGTCSVVIGYKYKRLEECQGLGETGPIAGVERGLEGWKWKDQKRDKETGGIGRDEKGRGQLVVCAVHERGPVIALVTMETNSSEKRYRRAMRLAT
ncbi:hypothetical protein BDQ17DRAFT_1362047 [Cyathus striatus]|nr:hypothetical protein BDQ17DRAFT_1362047 [Cyathus striatus]